MLQYRLSAIRNIATMKTFGIPAMFICDAENKALSLTGSDHDTKAWNLSFGQSFYIPIQS